MADAFSWAYDVRLVDIASYVTHVVSISIHTPREIGGGLCSMSYIDGEKGMA